MFRPGGDPLNPKTLQDLFRPEGSWSPCHNSADKRGVSIHRADHPYATSWSIMGGVIKVYGGRMAVQMQEKLVKAVNRGRKKRPLITSLWIWETAEGRTQDDIRNLVKKAGL